MALYLDHRVPCLLTMLGTLAAGGFYTVLDTAQPPERVRRITDQLAPVLLVTDEEHRAAAEALGLDCPLLLWESACTEEPDPYLLRRLRQDALDVDLAYVLFTSGSTGAPKGVAVQHRAVLAYSAWAAETFGIDETTVFGNQTPFYFSMSVTDLYTALRTGAQLQVLPKRLFSFPVQLLDYLTTHGVNTLYWVPSALGGVVRWKALDYTALPPLRTILFAGETMPTPYLNYWRAHYPAALFANLFGPTETTDICAYYIVDRPFADDEPFAHRPRLRQLRAAGAHRRQPAGSPRPGGRALCAGQFPGGGLLQHARKKPPSGSAPIPCSPITPKPSTAPGTWCAMGKTGCCGTWGAPTTRSNTWGTASSWARSKRPPTDRRACRAVPACTMFPGTGWCSSLPRGAI